MPSTARPSGREYFLIEAAWDAEAVNTQRVRLLREGSATAPHPNEVLVIDGTEDRKDARSMAHMTPSSTSGSGRWWPTAAYSDTFTRALVRADVPFRAGNPPQPGQLGTGRGRLHPVEAGLEQPALTRRLDAGGAHLRGRPHPALVSRGRSPGRLGPNQRSRLVVATTDPGRLPPRTTWYLLTNLPHSRSRRQPPFVPAGLAEVVRLYGLRGWVEQVKNELGWAQFQVRSGHAIRRHWTLVCCALELMLAGHPQPGGSTGRAGVLTLCGVGPRSVAGDPTAGQELADPLARTAARLVGLADRAAAPIAAEHA